MGKPVSMVYERNSALQRGVWICDINGIWDASGWLMASADLSDEYCISFTRLSLSHEKSHFHVKV